MRLAVLADSKGHILGLAVCTVTFGNDPKTVHEISMYAEPVDNRHFQTHTIDLPSHLVHKTDDEIRVGLREIHEEMYLDVTQGQPCLRKHTRRHQTSN
jgi:hypothetical protein